MANYPQELTQDAVCQSHTGHMTGLWFLPNQPLRLNTNEWMNVYFIPCVFQLTFTLLVPAGGRHYCISRTGFEHSTPSRKSSWNSATADANSRSCAAPDTLCGQCRRRAGSKLLWTCSECAGVRVWGNKHGVRNQAEKNRKACLFLRYCISVKEESLQHASPRNW